MLFLESNFKTPITELLKSSPIHFHHSFQTLLSVQQSQYKTPFRRALELHTTRLQGIERQPQPKFNQNTFPIVKQLNSPRNANPWNEKAEAFATVNLQICTMKTQSKSRLKVPSDGKGLVWVVQRLHSNNRMRPVLLPIRKSIVVCIDCHKLQTQFAKR